MKKLLLSIIGVTIATANAYTTVNLNNGNYSCNNIHITTSTTESTVQSNCKNYSIRYSEDVVGGDDGANSHNLQPVVPVVEPMTDDDVRRLAKVKFTTDQGQKMECFYKNSKLYKCKASGSAVSNESAPINK
jgi:hypothetical protein